MPCPWPEGQIAQISHEEADRHDAHACGRDDKQKDDIAALILHAYPQSCDCGIGTGDEVIPASESQWLANEIAPQFLRAFLVSPAITHVEVGGKPTFSDKVALVHFMAQMMRCLRG